MDPGYQKSVLATASASAKEAMKAMKGKGGDLDSMVASLKARSLLGCWKVRSVGLVRLG